MIENKNLFNDEEDDDLECGVCVSFFALSFSQCR
jgi:hypothetical protein